MLEIGTYHFTYRENRRVCCTAVSFFCRWCAIRLYTFEIIWYDKNVTDITTEKDGGCMSDKEMLQKNVEEFSRIQKYMLLIEDKESAVYKEIKDRYIELKVILTASGVSLVELDKIKEWQLYNRKHWGCKVRQNAKGFMPPFLVMACWNQKLHHLVAQKKK